MTAPDFEDQPPQTDRLSAYDERHLVTYLRLLDAEKDGAHWEEAVAIIFSVPRQHQWHRFEVVI